MYVHQPARVAEGCNRGVAHTRVQLSGGALVLALEARRRHQDNDCQVPDTVSAKLHRTFLLKSLKLFYGRLHETAPCHDVLLA